MVSDGCVPSPTSCRTHGLRSPCVRSGSRRCVDQCVVSCCRASNAGRRGGWELPGSARPWSGLGCGRVVCLGFYIIAFVADYYAGNYAATCPNGATDRDSALGTERDSILILAHVQSVSHRDLPSTAYARPSCRDYSVHPSQKLAYFFFGLSRGSQDRLL